MAFRLHIDFEVGEDKEKAIQLSGRFLNDLKELILRSEGEFKTAKARLLRDEDMGANNYLSVDANGHNKKGKIKLFA